MSKIQKTNKESKKEPALSTKEKKANKLAKKAGKDALHVPIAIPRG